MCRQRYLQLLVDQRVTANEPLRRARAHLDRHSAYRRLDESRRESYFAEYQTLLRKYGKVPLTAEA